MITCENGQTVSSSKWNGLSKSFSSLNMIPFNLMDDFVFGDGLKKPMANFLEWLCWRIRKRFTMRFLTDLLGGQNESEVFF